MKNRNEIEDFELKLFTLQLWNGRKVAVFSKLWFWILDRLTLQNMMAVGLCFRMNWTLNVCVHSKI